MSVNKALRLEATALAAEEASRVFDDFSLDMTEVVEGLKGLSAICREHIEMLAEREEAMRLMRPDGEWPVGETLLSAIRNVLQAKWAAEGNSQIEGDLLDAIAAELGLKEWTPATLLEAVKRPTFEVTDLVASTIVSGPPYDYAYFGFDRSPVNMFGGMHDELRRWETQGWEVICVDGPSLGGSGRGSLLLRRPAKTL